MKTPEEGYALGWADAIYAYESKQKENMSTVDELMALAQKFAAAWHANQSSRVVAAYDDESERKTLRAAIEVYGRAEYERGRNQGITDVHDASPPNRKPLTDEQILACIQNVGGIRPMGITRDVGPYEVTKPTLFSVWFARAIERAHGIGDE